MAYAHTRLKGRWAHRGPGELVILDNRDSFVFNLAHRVVEAGWQGGVVVVRSQEVTAAEVLRWGPAGVILSPGPGHPREAGVCVELVSSAPENLPILGVCLGHQAIALAFGAEVVPSWRPMHGKASSILHHKTGLFQGIPSPMSAARYHSLIVQSPLPRELAMTGSFDQMIMAFEHTHRPVWGVQFHPESVLTPQGVLLLGNFLKRCER